CLSFSGYYFFALHHFKELASPHSATLSEKPPYSLVFPVFLFLFFPFLPNRSAKVVEVFPFAKRI
ncbi:hypothetical protein, partial [uncultured Algoriphagus sp.]